MQSSFSPPITLAGVCSLVVQLVEQDEVYVLSQPGTFQAELTTFSGHLIRAES